MIELLELLDEIDKILIAKKKKKILLLVSNNKQKLPDVILPVKKTFTFENLRFNEARDVDFGKSINGILYPFASEIKRYGVVKQYSGSNISFYSSLITILFNEFTKKKNDKLSINHKASHILFIGDMIKHSILWLKKNDVSKFKWNKKEIIDSLNKYESDKIIIGLFSLIYNINIFIINVAKEKMMIVYPENNFNKYKSSIMLSYYNNTYEPLSYCGKFMMNLELNNSKYLYIKLITVDYESFVPVDISNTVDSAPSKVFKNMAIDELI